MAGAVPEDQLDPVSPLRPEHGTRRRSPRTGRPPSSRERERPGHPPLCGSPRAGSPPSPDRARRANHAPALRARITTAIAFGLTRVPTRTMTPEISSSIPLVPDRRRRRGRTTSGLAAGSGPAPTRAGTNGTTSVHAPARLATPPEDLLRRQPVAARHLRHDRARRQRLLDDRPLLVDRPPAAATFESGSETAVLARSPKRSL